jgi:hypothetical protein
MTTARLLLAATLLLLPGAAALASDNKKAGSECLIDTDCEDNRCSPYPDGRRYCVAPGKTCSAPGADGASPGKQAVKGVCFECVRGMGWRACPSAPATAGEPVRPTETRNR